MTGLWGVELGLLTTGSGSVGVRCSVGELVGGLDGQLPKYSQIEPYTGGVEYVGPGVARVDTVAGTVGEGVVVTGCRPDCGEDVDGEQSPIITHKSNKDCVVTSTVGEGVGAGAGVEAPAGAGKAQSPISLQSRPDTSIVLLL